jgi:hypothetical protein
MMPFGFWELVIIAILVGVPLLAAGLVVWLIVRRSSNRASLRRPLPGEDPGQDHP